MDSFAEYTGRRSKRYVPSAAPERLILGTIRALPPSRSMRPWLSVALKSDRDELSSAVELMGNISTSIRSKTNFPHIVPNALKIVFMSSLVRADECSLEDLNL